MGVEVNYITLGSAPYKEFIIHEQVFHVFLLLGFSTGETDRRPTEHYSMICTTTKPDKGESENPLCAARRRATLDATFAHFTPHRDKDCPDGRLTLLDFAGHIM